MLPEQRAVFDSVARPLARYQETLPPLLTPVMLHVLASMLVRAVRFDLLPINTTTASTVISAPTTRGRGRSSQSGPHSLFSEVECSR
jgi:hypothetical protein